MDLQVCHCGWSKVTTYQGLRIHQGRMGCTPMGMSIPQIQQFSYLPHMDYHPNPVITKKPSVSINKPPERSEQLSRQVCHCGWSSQTTYQGLRIHQGKMGCTPKGMSIPKSEQHIWKQKWEKSHSKEDKKPVTTTQVKKEKPPVPQNLSTKKNPEPKQPPVPKIYRPIKTEQAPPVKPSLDDYCDKTPDSTFWEQIDLRCQPQVFTTYTNSPTTQTPAKDSAISFFKTPPAFNQNVQTSSEKVRRSLDFSTGTPEVKQGRMRADLQQKIHKREQKMLEVKSSEKTCTNSLDAEWIEINSVFFEMIKVVEDARQKALEPVEKRRQEVKREAQNLLHKLQKEIDKLKDSMDELEANPDLQVSVPPDLEDSTHWENVDIDTSFSFGSLRATTSTMMKEIQQELENLSSIELKRIPKFAVDVRLDSATANRSLVLSDDGKTVRDGELNPDLPDPPERFDVFGSVLGINVIDSGRSYWEVEVGRKTGWELGVAQGSVNRKGVLSVDQDHGYWVTMHHEGETYAALTVPPIGLSLMHKPEKVGVFVDYEEGLVSFYDVTNRSHMYSFTECSFGGEIVPYFSPHPNHNDENSAPLIISDVLKN